MNDYECVENGIYIEKIYDDKILDFKIACIFDEFTKKCYEGLANFIYITPDNWKENMIKNKPDIFLVESVWNGENNCWSNIIANNKRQENKILKEIIDWCNYNNIPTIFWNKEDPVNYNVFIANTKLFDYVFTSDENSIKKYKQDLNHNRVFTLPFAANPKIHNPIKYYIPNNKSFFAGTYYRHKFNERKTDLKKLLNLAIEYGELDIYDRYFEENNPLYEFPNVYKPYIKGCLEVDEMYKRYKQYKIALNVNCVKDSPTMFSRRVYECLASGTPVISTYSLGINEIFSGLVVSSDSEEELREEFLKLKDEEYYYDKMVRGIREVLSNHTYEKRLVFILNTIGIKVISKNPTLAVIIKTDNVKEFEMLRKQYTSQNYKYKNLYIITKNEELKKLRDNKKLNMNFMDENMGKSKIENVFKEDYIGFLSTKNNYGIYYFEDLINGRLYSDADIIGKKSYYNVENKLINKDMDFMYVDEIDFDKCIIKKDILREVLLDDFFKYINDNKIYNFKGKFLSIDRNNLICY